MKKQSTLLRICHSTIRNILSFILARTGEKAYEEFYVPGERLNMDRFSSLGVIEEVQKRPLKEIDAFFVELESIFASPSFTKEEVVKAIQRFIPHFEHEEKGKNLDQKM